MKKNIFLTILIVLIASFSLVAQNVQGKAYYISNSKVNMDFGGRQISEAQKERIKERQKKLTTKNYVLEFNGPVSLFTEEEVLNQAVSQTSGRGGAFRMLLDQNAGNYYKNVATQEYNAQRDIYGKQFLIKDSLRNFDWQLGNEVKVIGKYTCFMATATIPATNNIFEEQEETTTTVTAWYAIEIPVSHGPEMFWGLPGLILELKTHNKVLLCSKIELGTEEAIVLTSPKKGKKVTQEEFDKLLTKKTKEVKEMYNNRRASGGRKNG